MLNICIKYRYAIVLWCQSNEWENELLNAEWQQINALKDFLSPFNEITDFCQGENYPTIYYSLVYYNKIFDHLDDYEGEAVLKVNLKETREKLKKYTNLLITALPIILVLY